MNFSYSRQDVKKKGSAFSFSFPRDLVVIVDTREQDPLFIRNPPKGLTLVRDGLKNGDYSIRGFEHLIMFERKKESDLAQYIGKDHKKTREKLDRCLDYEFVGLVIEAEERDLFVEDKAYTTVPVELFRQAICSLEIRYGMHVYYSRSRREIERWVLDRMIKFLKVKREINTP